MESNGEQPRPLYPIEKRAETQKSRCFGLAWSLKSDHSHHMIKAAWKERKGANMCVIVTCPSTALSGTC
jgi:hypothetical protein